ncbi:MAG: PilZ domain-containing protein [Syntrophobacteraceae bacterium]
MREDQRKYRRFKTKDEIFAAFVIPTEPVIVGRILDVSRGGVGIQYLATRKLETGPTSIKIFALNSPNMERIESRVVYDFEIPEESWSTPMVRRCGIKFEGHRSEVQAKVKRIVQDAPAVL